MRLDQERCVANRLVRKPNAMSVAPIPSRRPVWEPVTGSAALSLTAVGPAGGGAEVGAVVDSGVSVGLVGVVSVGPVGGFVSTSVDAVVGPGRVGPGVVGPVAGGAVDGGAVTGVVVVTDAVVGCSVVTGDVVVVDSGGAVVVTSGSQSTDTLNPPLERPSGPNRI